MMPPEATLDASQSSAQLNGMPFGIVQASETAVRINLLVERNRDAGGGQLRDHPH